MANILIVEAEPATAGLIATNLRHEGHEVQLACDSHAANEAVRGALPDLVILDWMIAGDSGVALLKRWRGEARTKELPIIMLTARGREADTVIWFDAGADDYLTKPFLTSELSARIRGLLRRRLSSVLETVLEVGSLRLDPAARRVSWGDVEIKLGLSEFRLLRFLMTYPERVQSRAQLLACVWGDHVCIEERTVDVHIKRLRDALTRAGCLEMVETVRGAGYRITGLARDVAA